MINVTTPIISKKIQVAMALLSVAVIVLLTYMNAHAFIFNPEGGGTNGAGHNLRQPYMLQNANLKLYLNMDGQVNDSSGNGNNGTPTALTLTTGMFNQAYSYNGTTSFIQGGNINSTFGSGNLSISAWIKADAGAPLGTIFSKENASGAIRAVDLHLLGSGAIRLELYDGTTDCALDTASVDYRDSRWHNVVAVRNSGTLYVYVDGIQRTSAADACGDNSSASTDYRIGRRTIGGATYFTGSIDDVRVYESVLTPTDVTALNTASQAPAVDQSIVAYWKLDEASGVTAFDASVNALNGTYTSATYETGIYNRGISFYANVNGVMTAPSSAKLDDMTSGLTLEAWVYPVTLGNGNIGRIINKMNSTNTSGWKLHLQAANAIRFLVSFGSGDMSVVSAANAYSLNTWNHVMLTWDGSTTATNAHIYINGKEVSYATQTNGSGAYNSDTATALRVGNSVGAGENFDGPIDDVRVYNRVFTNYEVYEHYRAGTGGS